MKNQDEYHNIATAETLDKFRRVLMNVFDGDADAMLGELESRMAAKYSSRSRCLGR